MRRFDLEPDGTKLADIGRMPRLRTYRSKLTHSFRDQAITLIEESGQGSMSEIRIFHQLRFRKERASR